MFEIIGLKEVYVYVRYGQLSQPYIRYVTQFDWMNGYVISILNIKIEMHCLMQQNISKFFKIDISKVLSQYFEYTCPTLDFFYTST